MDDDFMTIVFSGDNKLTEFLLRILLDRTDLTVKQSMTQKEKHNIFGRSVRLDILAVDTEGRQYNIEIQRADKGASEKRADFPRVRTLRFRQSESRFLRTRPLSEQGLGLRACVRVRERRQAAAVARQHLHGA